MCHRWLLKCAPGIQSLRHVDPYIGPSKDVIDEEDVDMRQLFTSVFPQLSGLLPPGADIQLDLCWGEASVQTTFSCCYPITLCCIVMTHKLPVNQTGTERLIKKLCSQAFVSDL